jgi:hypothetical protein
MIGITFHLIHIYFEILRIKRLYISHDFLLKLRIMSVEIEVYTLPACPYCPHAMKLNEVAPSFGQNVAVEEVNSWSEEG